MHNKQLNYRKQLIITYFRLDTAISHLYHMAFSIGLHWDWQELKSEIRDRGWLPLDMAYLKVIEHVAVPGIIEMIEILEEVRKKLATINQLSKEELVKPDCAIQVEREVWQEDYTEEENIDMWQQLLFVDLLSVFEASWNLGCGSNPPLTVYDQFSRMYFNAEVEIPSEDQNVRILEDALNEALEANSRTVFEV